jgi:2-aminoadipate transaminase
MTSMTQLKIVQTDLPPGFIDLGMGNPDPSLLPLELLRSSSEAFFARKDVRPLHYGAEQGDGDLRRELSGFLAEAYRLPVEPGSLFITAGASSALDLICTLFTRPGDVIFVEEPSYFLALRIFEDHELKVVSIPMDDEGLCVEDLEKQIIEFQPKLIYIIPTHQNPTGRTLTQERRETLVAMARRTNVLIVADEVYHFLDFSGSQPQPLAVFCENGEQVISVNSFSKILAPGLRLGWIQAHPTVIQRLAGSGLLDSGGGMNPFTSALVRDLVESGGLKENIRNLCKEYARRLDAMGNSLKRHLPDARWIIPQGGFFFWVQLPGLDATELRREAKKFEVDIRPGVLFSSRNGMPDRFRLSFSYYEPDRIEEGIQRLRDCLDNYQPGVLDNGKKKY